MGRKFWNIKIAKQEHEVIFNRGLIIGFNTLIIDGKAHPLPNNLYSRYIGYDLEIKLGDKPARFVNLGGWADIAVDGHYINSGKPYLPLEEFKWWSWFFISLCAMGIVYFGGGSLAIIIALLGVMWSLQISICPELTLGQKLFYNMLIVAGVLVLSFGLSNLILLL